MLEDLDRHHILSFSIASKSTVKDAAQAVESQFFKP